MFAYSGERVCPCASPPHVDDFFVGASPKCLKHFTHLTSIHRFGSFLIHGMGSSASDRFSSIPNYTTLGPDHFDPFPFLSNLPTKNEWQTSQNLGLEFGPP